MPAVLLTIPKVFIIRNYAQSFPPPQYVVEWRPRNIKVVTNTLAWDWSP